MGSVVVAEFDHKRKLEPQAPPVKIDALAGFLAMQRWGRISIEQYALARQVSHQHAVKSLKDYRDDKYVCQVRLTSRHFPGVGAMYYGLTKKGYDLVSDASPEIGAWKKPPAEMLAVKGFFHNQDVISSLISARAQLEAYPVDLVCEKADHFKGRIRDTGLMADGKFLVPDAILKTEDYENASATYLIEVDRGTERIASMARPGKTLVDMFARYWRFLESVDDPSQYRILFIANVPPKPSDKDDTERSRQRIADVIAGVPWGQMSPIGDWTPDRAFRFATFNDAVGRSAAKSKRIYGDFWGGVWTKPVSGDVTRLLRGA